MNTAHEIWVFLNEKYGAISNDDDVTKVEKDECLEHDHNTMVVEDCATSWSSHDDDDSTTRSLDKDDDDGYESDAYTSSSTSSHCFVSPGVGKVSMVM